MMGRIGLPEIILIFFIFLLLFGPSKLPEIGKSLGKAIREFRQAAKELAENVLQDGHEKSS